MPDPTTRRPLILVSVMAAMFMIAMEATIVSTAMPQIAAQLGDLHLYSWVFASFLLTQTAMTVVFGKLSDTYGRKPVMLIGIAIFLAGSLLCGFAWSMPSLIVFRLVQGVGAGAILPVSITVIGDVYSIQERAKIQGWLASVWGISSVLGPLAGGLIVQYLHWAWIFWINIPVGVAAAAGFILHLHEGVARTARRVDVLGASLFSVAIAALMTAFTELGTSGTAIALAALALCIVSAALFLWQERRAHDPMIDLRLWGRRPIASANASTLFAGMAVIGLTTFLPMYVQGVMNRSVLVAGFALTMVVLGWPIGATLAARTFNRFGLRPILLFGALLMPVGASVFLFLGPASSPVWAGIGSGILGLGMGFLSNSSMLIIQSCVGWAERGSATASNIFARNLGSALGAAALGGVLNLSLAHAGRTGSGVTFDEIRRLLSDTAGGGALIDPDIQAALGHALHLTFWGVFAMALGALLTALLVPTVRVAPDAAAEGAAAE